MSLTAAEIDALPTYSVVTVHAEVDGRLWSNYTAMKCYGGRYEWATSGGASMDTEGLLRWDATVTLVALPVSEDSPCNEGEQ